VFGIDDPKHSSRNANFHRKDANTLRKPWIRFEISVLNGFTKQVNLAFVVSPLRSWRLCGKNVLYCGF
jgi:hypothetical protein